ncbi:MAG: Wzz/FepE/Etk N-terminal domain-containing protein [candidate division Zixibacteria bacterium]
MSRKITFREKSPDNSLNNDTATGNSFNFEISMFEMARLILRKKKLISILTLSIMLLTTGYLFTLPNLYTSTATILPSGKSGAGMSAYLKSLVGLGIPAAISDENSSALFPVILNSQLVAKAVLAKEYEFEHNSESKKLTLPEYFDQTDPDKLRRSMMTITTIKMSQKTGEIAMGVETEFPEFSQAVLTKYIAQLEEFNLYKRRTSATDNEKYLARQIEKTKVKLTAAENKLETFQLANQNWAMTDSPEILKELMRLKREVEIASGTYLMLTQQYEMAKFVAKKDVPITRILDAPSLPTQKSGPFRRNIILLTGLLSCGLICFGIVLWDIFIKATGGKNKHEFGNFKSEIKIAFPRTNRMISRIKKSQEESTEVV